MIKTHRLWHKRQEHSPPNNHPHFFFLLSKHLNRFVVPNVQQATRMVAMAESTKKKLALEGSGPPVSDWDADINMPAGIPAQSFKASKALVRHIKKEARAAPSNATKLNPFGDEESAHDLSDIPITLVLVTKTHVAKSSDLKPGKIALPHPLYDPVASAMSICLIVADPQRAFKDIIASSEFPDSLRHRIGRVIGFSKLRAKFSRFEEQRVLYSSHDLFLADNRIVNRLPKALGKTFYKTSTKRPIPIALYRKKNKDKTKTRQPLKQRKVARGKEEENKADENILPTPTVVREINKALGAATVGVSRTINTTIRVGWANWDPQHIADNIQAVIPTLVTKFIPNQWSNVRSFQVKGPQTVGLPVWMTSELWVGRHPVVKKPKNQKRKTQHAEAENEPKKATVDRAEQRKAPEKANTKKKRKYFGFEDYDSQEEEESSREHKQKKRKAIKEEDEKAVKELVRSRESRLSKEKAAARTAMDSGDAT